MITADKYSQKSAELSDCGKYRYALFRVWDINLPQVAFVGLNPSTADAELDDPTINKCVAYAKNWGFGSIVMLNLFAFRSTDPTQLYQQVDPVGSENHHYLAKYGLDVKIVVAAWGNHGVFLNRHQAVIEMLKPKLNYLKLNLTGQPAHPLYLKSDLKPTKWFSN